MIRRIVRYLKRHFKLKHHIRHLKNKRVRFKGEPIVSLKTHLEGPNFIDSEVNIRNSHIGHHTYLSQYCYFPNTKIGRYTSIGRKAGVAFGNHPQSPYVSFSPAFSSTLNQANETFVDKEFFQPYILTDEKENFICEIGHDCWIGDNVTIINGVKIGDGALVAAGSVVTKNVDPFTVVAGVPARFLKHRFTIDQIEFLNQIQWWDWDVEKVKENVLLFHDIERFMDNFNVK